VDLLIEFVVSLVVQLLSDVLGELAVDGFLRGLAEALEHRVGRYAVFTVLGLAFGVVWGWHLSSRAQPPNLLWVSLGFAFAALMVRLLSTSVDRPFVLREAFEPPWRWSPQRLTGLVFLNLGLATGVLAGWSLTG
jgi:hypothetical protein